MLQLKQHKLINARLGRTRSGGIVNKRWIYIIIGALFVILIIAFIVESNSKKPTNTNSTATTNSTPTTTSVTSPTTTTTGTTTTSTSNLSTTLYKNTANKFQIYPPKNSLIDETGVNDTAVVFKNPTADTDTGGQYYTNMYIMPAQSSDGKNLSQIMAETKKQTPNYLLNFKLIDDEKTADGSGYLWGGTYTSGKYTLRNLFLFKVINGKLYSVCATALASSWQTRQSSIKESLQTFKVL